MLVPFCCCSRLKPSSQPISCLLFPNTRGMILCASSEFVAQLLLLLLLRLLCLYSWRWRSCLWSCTSKRAGAALIWLQRCSSSRSSEQLLLHRVGVEMSLRQKVGAYAPLAVAAAAAAAAPAAHV